MEAAKARRKAAGVIQRRGALYVFVQLGRLGGGLTMGSPQKLAADVDVEVLGKTVESKLAESRVMTAEEAAEAALPASNRRHLAAFDARGWSGLYRGSDSCAVRWADDELSIIPYRPEGTGLVQELSEALLLAMPAHAASIGEAVRACLHKSRTLRLSQLP